MDKSEIAYNAEKSWPTAVVTSDECYGCCGSGGMFVQTGHFVEDHSKRAVNEAIKVYGTELKSNNTRLAKMNLAIHGIEGKIIESNSFYSDPHDLAGKCDFVMANPPFNVNKVDKNKDFLKTDKRLFSDVGLPKADNGNYLWIQCKGSSNCDSLTLPAREFVWIFACLRLI